MRPGTLAGSLVFFAPGLSPAPPSRDPVLGVSCLKIAPAAARAAEAAPPAMPAPVMQIAISRGYTGRIASSSGSSGSLLFPLRTDPDRPPGYSRRVQPVAVRILHRPATGSLPLEGWLADARRRNAAQLAENGVDMTRLESRPSRTGLWEYVFFVDLKGHQQDANVAQALEQLRERASFLKILGSYPVTL